MRNPLRKKGFPLFNEVGELIEGTHANGLNAFHAGQPTPTPSTQNVGASASISYEPAIDPELLGISLERGRVSDNEMDCAVPLDSTQKSFHEREMDSFISTVRRFIYHTHIGVLISTRMTKPQRWEREKERPSGSGLYAPRL